MHAFPYVWLLSAWRPSMSWVTYPWHWYPAAGLPRFLRLVTVDFDSGWSYRWIILAHVWRVPRGVIHMSTSVLVALYSKVFKVFLCAYHSWQIATMSLSNNVPLRVYAHTTGWPPPCNLFFSNKQDYISSHSEVSNPTASSTSPGSDFLCSCKQMNRDILTPICIDR